MITMYRLRMILMVRQESRLYERVMGKKPLDEYDLYVIARILLKHSP